MKKTGPGRKSPTHFEQVPVATVRKIVLANSPKPATAGPGKPVRAIRGKAKK